MRNQSYSCDCKITTHKILYSGLIKIQLCNGFDCSNRTDLTEFNPGHNSKFDLFIVLLMVLFSVSG